MILDLGRHSDEQQRSWEKPVIPFFFLSPSLSPSLSGVDQ